MKDHKDFNDRSDRKNRVYIAIDLKSFYASVECGERDLDPLKTNLVVADESRTEKTICLAVSPSLKAMGVPGRPRLFEVVRKVREINAERLAALRASGRGRSFTGKSSDADELARDPSLAVDYIVACPRMAHYIRCSTAVYSIYLRYIAPEDIHVYSIDEVFMDVTDYLKTAGCSPRELAMRIIHDVLSVTGITATAGIGTNLYLAKVAMDIVAKHIPADKDGVRIAELDEMSYREKLWDHEPITDFWRVGPGIARKLAKNGMRTMGDVARCSVGADNSFHNEDFLFKLFGVNAELLIDHAWGREPVTIADIKAYRPQAKSVGSGQVLPRPYAFDEARNVVREMADSVALQLTAGGYVTDSVTIGIGFDRVPEGVTRRVALVRNYYGKEVPPSVHTSAKIGRLTSSAKAIGEAAQRAFDSMVPRDLAVRRIFVTVPVQKRDESEKQLDFFAEMEAAAAETSADAGTNEGSERGGADSLAGREPLRAARSAEESDRKDEDIQSAILDIRKKFGKNSIIKAGDLEDGATTLERNNQIGGHKA